MTTNPKLLGTVEDVHGATVGVVLDESTASGLAFVDGQGYRIGQVGSFVRVAIGYVDLFGLVTQVGAGAVPERLTTTEPYGRRWLTVELIGEGDEQGGFRKGLSQYPTVGDPVYLVSEKDLSRIYGRPSAPNLVAVGHLASAEAIPTLVDVDKLITRHSAIVGTTGAGKSTTVASLLVSLSDPARYPSARILVLDVHGEYAAALRDRAAIFRLGADEKAGEQPLFVPYWALTSDELMAVGMGTLDDKGRGAIIEKITALKLESIRKTPRAGVTTDNLTVDTPVPFSIHRLWFDLHCDMRATFYERKGEQQTRKNWALELEKGKPLQPGNTMKAIPPVFRPPKDVAGDSEKIRWSQRAGGLNVGSAIDVLGSRLRDPRFDFLFRPGPWFPDEAGQPEQDLDTLISQWIGGRSPISILDLSGIPVSIAKELIGALLRVVYDSLFWAKNMPEGGRERPLLVVLEEAHSYLGQGDSSAASLAVKRIAKEGRKYGVGAMIVSQRPAEVDSTILSQCGTIFAMRLSNPTDRGHVTGVVSDNLAGLFDMLPALRTGEMIIVGEAVRLPVRTILDLPPANRRPDSGDPRVFGGETSPGRGGIRPGGWDREWAAGDFVRVVEVWRSQDATSWRIVENRKVRIKRMERKSVTSSSIASVGYDESTSTLEIEFVGGNVYQYFDVPKREYEGLMAAGSHGQYFHQNIKSRYRYSRV